MLVTVTAERGERSGGEDQRRINRFPAEGYKQQTRDYSCLSLMSMSFR